MKIRSVTMVAKAPAPFLNYTVAEVVDYYTDPVTGWHCAHVVAADGPWAGMTIPVNLAAAWLNIEFSHWLPPAPAESTPTVRNPPRRNTL